MIYIASKITGAKYTKSTKNSSRGAKINQEKGTQL